MVEMPENLLIPKSEHNPPPYTPTNNSPATDKSPNIKERLNLHVKRRLQQEPAPLVSPTERQQQQQSARNVLFMVQRKEKQKEPAKTRRPYQKRAEKIKKIIDNEAGSAAGAVRKYKRHKARQSQLGSSVVGGNAAGSGASAGTSAVGSGAISDESTVTHFEQNGDDDGSQDGGAIETEARGAAGTPQRDKEKCPDVLGLVLSMKKRALLQDPEVQEFMRKVMSAVKN